MSAEIGTVGQRESHETAQENHRFSAAMTSPAKILIVDDDVSVRDLLRMNLPAAQFVIDEAKDGLEGVEKALAGDHDLLVLDINLPGIDGLEVCKRVRAVNSFLPILMLTANSEEIDRILGLELGADDYLTKPFSVREVVARIKAILRRASLLEAARKSVTQRDVLVTGDLSIDLTQRKVVLSGELVPLSNMEFELLAFLASSPGTAYSREELMEKVWGYAAAGYERNVSTHINRLRKKLEPDPENPTYVRTVRGYGYALVTAEELGTH